MVDSKNHDSLLGGRVAIAQDEHGFRVAVDSVLLAAAVAAPPEARVLDVGCGDGGATLCLAWRAPEVRIHGIDVRTDALARFAENAGANGWRERVSCERCDVANGVPDDLREAFDWAMSNPPYLPPERMDLRATAGEPDPATTETVPLPAWVAFMAGCLAEGGQLAVIHRADRVDQLLAALEPLCGDIRLCPIWPRAGDAARRILVLARKESGGPARLHAGLVLHARDGSYTRAARDILEDGGGLSFD